MAARRANPWLIWLFIGGALVYQFSVTALGILLASFSASMPQFALLMLPVIVIMYLLSGGDSTGEHAPLATECDADGAVDTLRRFIRRRLSTARPASTLCGRSCWHWRPSEAHIFWCRCCDFEKSADDVPIALLHRL